MTLYMIPVETIVCACGCGLTIPKYKDNDRWQVRPRRFIIGHQKHGWKLTPTHLAKLQAGRMEKLKDPEWRKKVGRAISKGKSGMTSKPLPREWNEKMRLGRIAAYRRKQREELKQLGWKL
jgi:hypothetical protein